MVEKLYVLTYSRDVLPFIEFITVLTTAYHCSYPKPYESADNNFVRTNLPFLTGGGKLKDPGIHDNSIIKWPNRDKISYC